MSNHREKTLGGLFVSLTALLATAAYLLLGFTIGGWHIYWILFLAIPLVSIIVDVVTNRKDISGKVTGIVALLCVITFILVGFIAHTWHPTWIIFFAIPISGVIVKILTTKGEEPPRDQNSAQ